MCNRLRNRNETKLKILYNNSACRAASFGNDESGKHEENNGSGNMIIHGDNLDALKALLPKYEGKVKCIYIEIIIPSLIQNRGIIKKHPVAV